MNPAAMLAALMCGVGNSYDVHIELYRHIPQPPHKRRSGSSGKATSNKSRCSCCKATLSRIDGFCWNRSCELFMADVEQIRRRTYGIRRQKEFFGRGEFGSAA